MSVHFKALILNQNGENFTREVKSIDKSFLKHGDVTVKVKFSGLNYKDALILKNGARLVKEFPHIPGIDFSGTVEESANDKFKVGDEVILTGWRVGEIYFGGYSQYAKVNGDFLIKKPKNLNLRQSMILGTAGLTALMCSFTTKATREELLLGDKVEDVIAYLVKKAKKYTVPGFLNPSYQNLLRDFEGEKFFEAQKIGIFTLMKKFIQENG